MKINRGAIIFIVIFGGIALVIAGILAISNMLRQSSGAPGENVGDLFSSLFPFGQGTARLPGVGTTPEDGGLSGPPPVLRLITGEPVAGFHVASTSVIRYSEVNTGHIFETSTGNLETVRRTNTTFPGIERAVWISDSSVIYQNETDNVIENSFVSFLPTGTDQTVAGVPLPGFKTVSVSPTLPQLVTSTRSANTTVSVSNLSGGQSRTIFSSPLKSWTVLTAGNEIFVETSPSDSPGFLYRILDGGALEKIVGGLRGLMAVLRPDGAYFAVSSIVDDSLRLQFLSRESLPVGTSPVGTLAEKCSWLAGIEPILVCGVPQNITNVSVEAWYMGLRSFSDDVWIIDPVKETATFVRNLESEAGRPIDIIDPQVSADGRYFLFKNKNDLSLWSLDLTR